MSKKKVGPVFINYVNGTLVQTASSADGELYRPYQYDQYVFMFQSIMGFMATYNEVKLNHWKIIALMISKMEASGRIVAYPSSLAEKLSLKDPRYIIKGLKELQAWNVIYRPNTAEPHIYMFNPRFLFKGKVKDNFQPFSHPKLFPDYECDVGPQPRIISSRIEPNLDFDIDINNQL